MKLRNKLIPLASVFATSAVLAPAVLTSCSASGMVDLTSGNFATTIKKAKTEGYVSDEKLAMELWMSSVNENSQVFIEDRYWGDSGLIKGFADLASINVTSIKGLCSNVSVKYVTVKDGEEDKKIPVVSMTYTLTVESNWSCDGYEYDEVDYAEDSAKFGSPLYYPIEKYQYYSDYGIPGKMYSSCAYEATWENIPVEFYDATEGTPSEYLPKILTEVTNWTIRPSLTNIQLMDQSRLDWKYTVNYGKEDRFVFDQDEVETTKIYTNSISRKFTNYEKLVADPEEAFYQNGGRLLKSEGIASYYLSDIKKQ